MSEEKEYRVKVSIKTEYVPTIKAKNFEEAKDKAWVQLIEMDPRKGHYILINGRNTYKEWDAKEEDILDDEDYDVEDYIENNCLT